MEFQDFPKMARLTRDVIVTEKIDGTNAQVCIAEDGTLLAGSRTRWITTTDDNFGFAAWVEAHREELLTLGPPKFDTLEPSGAFDLKPDNHLALL
jgi:hypothetical protein